MSTNTQIMGADGDTIAAALRKEVKRQLRGAPNAIAQTAGADADPAIVAVLTITGDLAGYLPFDAP